MNLCSAPAPFLSWSSTKERHPFCAAADATRALDLAAARASAAHDWSVSRLSVTPGNACASKLTLCCQAACSAQRNRAWRFLPGD